MAEVGAASQGAFWRIGVGTGLGKEVEMARGPRAVLWCLASRGMLGTCTNRKLDRITLYKALSSRLHWN